ncbi:class I SAM-dependent methyltransferase [Actinophytocola algeriensis]|uniref:SAM-dependent methyltransferase n=1 Tax=Actinophytocola algeriensis TaxID=1768010 RepID=A0A7W7Q8Z3_9PSEU|nr:class I SAM-dependent methyltransferase [Actinophytocola algeriensis]MBB4909231.1 SAM-dependent methyltransferase [Actinophytocola algeriensis]MBE1474381.1 SAM-dependent methyltransferase [Actinophytocola algeriensis]
MDYLAINKANWDERAPAHATSPMYALDRYEDPAHLSDTVRYDQPRLGNIDGLRGVHLQCHIGTDTISLARLGARMTGLDLSPASLEEARKLALATNTSVDFHEADVYDATAVLGEGGFDLVYTGIGALCWLPDIARWAQVVAALLTPGGRLFIREAHPMLMTLGDDLRPHYPYFETAEPIVEEDEGTYTGDDTVFGHRLTHSWDHGLAETITGLLEAGMRLTALAEHDSVPWNALPGHMTEDDHGEWRLTDRPRRLAASYTLQAVKEG